MKGTARRGLVTILIVSAGVFAISELLLAGLDGALPNEMTVASKQTNDLLIAIRNSGGRLKGGENSFCVMFQKRSTQEPADVQNVSVDFALLVGKIQEEPIRSSQLSRDRTGRYCGQVNLGKQYYNPANYYAFVLYTDMAGKKRKQRLFLSIR